MYNGLGTASFYSLELIETLMEYLTIMKQALVADLHMPDCGGRVCPPREARRRAGDCVHAIQGSLGRYQGMLVHLHTTVADPSSTLPPFDICNFSLKIKKLQQKSRSSTTRGHCCTASHLQAALEVRISDATRSDPCCPYHTSVFLVLSMAASRTP